jgi:hypothetical protein
MKHRLQGIVTEIAQAAMALGADAEDTNGIIRRMCEATGLDPFAWLCVCREIEARDTQHKPRRIGFIQ